MMIYAESVLFLLYLVLFCEKCSSLGAGKTEGDANSGTISFGPPDLNDEESESLHMPKQLKCDACIGIAYLLRNSYSKAESKTKSKTLTESELIEATEDVCDSQFQEYGITQIEGKKRLKGPGLDTAHLPGITQSGGKWPVRLHQICHEYMGVYGEDMMYDQYKLLKSHEQFSKFLCEDSGELAFCSKTQKGEL